MAFDSTPAASRRPSLRAASQTGLLLLLLAAHLVVHLQRVALSSGLEVLRVGVQAQVDLLVEALHVDRVPVLVVQQAAHGHGHAAAAQPGPAVICGGGNGLRESQGLNQNKRGCRGLRWSHRG